MNIMSITAVAQRINELADRFEIGNLQSIRKELKNLDRPGVSTIFSSKSTLSIRVGDPNYNIT
jgi:hypothetical protein